MTLGRAIKTRTPAANTQYKTVGVQWFVGICARFNILVGGQVCSPKTQPFHIVKRWHLFEKTTL